MAQNIYAAEAGAAQAAGASAAAEPTHSTGATASSRGALGLPAGLVARAPEALLLVALSSCVTMVALQGFVVAPALQFNIALLVAISCALQSCLAWAASSSRRHVVGGIAFAVLVVVVVAVGMVMSTGPDPLADVEGNNLSFCLTLVVANLVAFSLSRRRPALFVLLAITLFTCGFIEYVYHAGLVVPSVVAMGCVGALFVVRPYALVEARGDAVGQPAHGVVALTALALVALACGVGALVWALLIAPLEPGRVVVKLFTEQRALPTEYVDNPLMIDEVEDPDALSTNLGSTRVYGSKSVQIDSDDPALAEMDDFIDEAREQAGSQGIYNPGVASDDGVYLYTYDVPSWWWLLLIPVPFVLLALAIIVRKLMRRARRHKIARLGEREQVTTLYVELCRTLGRLGLGRPAEQTPAEFARDAAERLEVFWAPAEGAVSWVDVSRAYERAHYGQLAPSEGDLAACWAAYDARFGCALRYTGRLKYALRWFWVL